MSELGLQVFFQNHHRNRTSDGELVIWPTQALETYWCAWPPRFDGTVGDPNATSNCIVNDHPTVVALHVLLEKVLALPDVRHGTSASPAPLFLVADLPFFLFFLLSFFFLSFCFRGLLAALLARAYCLALHALRVAASFARLGAAHSAPCRVE